jgi:hypothetical protein
MEVPINPPSHRNLHCETTLARDVVEAYVGDRLGDVKLQQIKLGFCHATRVHTIAHDYQWDIDFLRVDGQFFEVSRQLSNCVQAHVIHPIRVGKQEI